MTCDKCLEFLSARLDSALTGEEERELEAHLAACPECRAAGAQLAAIQEAFGELEEVPAPEGFTRDVMERIRAEKKVLPLFKRPQVRALAGLAACLALAAGLYGASLPREGDEMDEAARGFSQDAQEECPMVNAALVDPESSDAPQIAAYSVPEDMQRMVPSACFAGPAELVLDRMPEGAGKLIPPETAVSPADGGVVYYGLSQDVIGQIAALAREQGITDSWTPEGGEDALYDLVILEAEK